MRAGRKEMEKKERGGGGREVSKLVFYARSTGTLTSGRWGWGGWGGGGCSVEGANNNGTNESFMGAGFLIHGVFQRL